MKKGSPIFGQYYPAKSPVHSLDPRSKIIISMLFMIAVFAVDDIWRIFAFAVLVVVSILAARIPMVYIVRSTRGVFFILAVTMLVHLFFTNGEVMFGFGPVAATYQGLQGGVLMSVRLLLVVWLTSLLALTTSPARLTDGIEYLLSPLQKIKVPAHELALMMTIALRFIPTLINEADKVMKAQMARGASFDARNPLKRAKSYIPLLIPLFVGSIRRADELAIAMEARCYQGGRGRVRLEVLSMSPADWLILIIFSLSVLLIIIRFGV